MRKGSFRNGLLDKGELTLPNGTQISGKWRNGQLKVSTCDVAPPSTMLSFPPYFKGRVVVALGNQEYLLDGVAETGNVLAVKNGPPFRLPVSRPSIPMHLFQ